MKAKIRFILFLFVIAVLAFGSITPSRADEELPPADATEDIITLQRVNDLAPGAASSDPSDMVVYGGNLYFAADANNGYGREIWELGNPIGIDINVGAGSSNPVSLTAFQNGIYFGADGGDGAGRELWYFDWSVGKLRVNDLASGSASSDPSDLVVYNGNLYFAADANNGYGREIWELGNPIGIDINVGAGSSSPEYLTVYNGSIYFSADGGDGAGRELWKFDWTNGTQRVADICPGSFSSLPAYLVVYDNALYFSADGCDGAGHELWMYDPINGVQLAADINIGIENSSPAFMTVYNGALYFSANGGDGAGRELWKYDPVNGADRVADIAPGVYGSYPNSLTVFNGALYFGADGNDGAGDELWMYNNTAIATFRSVKSYDGWVLESGENTNVGGTFNSNAPTINLGDDAQNKQYRSILSFNTSTLPDNVTIVSATLKVRKYGQKGANPFAVLGNILVDINKGPFGGNNALQTSDFQVAASKAGAGTIKNLPDFNGFFTSVLAKTAYPFVNASGVTQFRLRFAKDDNNDHVANFLQFYSADSTDMSDYPLLEVKYYVP